MCVHHSGGLSPAIKEIYNLSAPQLPVVELFFMLYYIENHLISQKSQLNTKGGGLI